MRILLDQAVYDMRNKGNIALLQVALMRLRKLWPQASLEVMTTAPYILQLYCPEVIPVDVYGVRNWATDRKKLNRLHRLVPRTALRILLEAREELEYRKSQRTEWNWKKNSLNSRMDISQLTAGIDHPAKVLGAGDSADLEQAICGADIVIATGGGYLVDSDKGSCMPVLSRLERSKQMGKLTAMVGQGVGIMNDPELKSQAKQVLPSVDMILVREENYSIPFLKSLGVPLEKIYMSGDDAVELGYYSRPTTLGSCIGVGIRSASYTEVWDEDIDQIRPVLHSVAAKYGTCLIGLPTTCTGKESDQFMIAKLLNGYPDSLNSGLRFESIPDLIQKVGKCRIVITGAFHSAVFALSQGIPVICLAKSQEYSIKFSGLKDQFGKGCQVLHLDDKEFSQKLADTSGWLWKVAEDLSPMLLDVARCQVEMGIKGYQLIQEAYRNR